MLYNIVVVFTIHLHESAMGVYVFPILNPPTLCDPMDCSLSVSSVHGIFQARVLEWIAISFSRESSQRRNRTQVSCIAGRRFTV